MTLTIRLKKRWITSVLRGAGKPQDPLPWQRGNRVRLSASLRAIDGQKPSRMRA
ncbi:MAG: hypothetical protein AAF566_06225 [Pseudomonadota bacterium]